MLLREDSKVEDFSLLDLPSSIYVDKTQKDFIDFCVFFCLPIKNMILLYIYVRNFFFLVLCRIFCYNKIVMEFKV